MMRDLIDGIFEKPVQLPLSPCAEWSDDCQGKKDYDGELLTISTRYWPGPGGGGALAFDTSTRQFSTLPHGRRPHAVAAIHVRYGAPGDQNFAPLCEAEFEAETEGEVKRQVEAWVKERANKIVALLLAAEL